ncbi:MAG TPA: hypothetical protein PLX29_07035 [Anaerolineaceae bacterium]|nr:hypothetical protein [Anaerolineaceae bacterium]
MFNFTVEKGQGLVEYALIIILIALVVILAVSFFWHDVEQYLQLYY